MVLRVEKRFEVPSQEELLDIVKREESKRKRALFIVLYLTAGRINEVVPCRYQRRKKSIKKTFMQPDGRERVERVGMKKWRDDIRYSGIKKKDIQFIEKSGHKIMLITMRNEKHRERKWKRLPTPIDKEQEFVDILLEYLDTLGEEDVLFPFTSVTGWSYVKSMSGFHPHFLRHIRLTHLVQLYNYDHILLMKFAGWSNPRPADRYLELGWEDLARTMH